MDNRDLTESSTPHNSLAHWPIVEAWWKSRRVMNGPAEELCDFCSFPPVKRPDYSMSIEVPQRVHQKHQSEEDSASNIRKSGKAFYWSQSIMLKSMRGSLLCLALVMLPQLMKQDGDPSPLKSKLAGLIPHQGMKLIGWSNCIGHWSRTFWTPESR